MSLFLRPKAHSSAVFKLKLWACGTALMMELLALILESYSLLCCEKHYIRMHVNAALCEFFVWMDPVLCKEMF